MLIRPKSHSKLPREAPVTELQRRLAMAAWRETIVVSLVVVSLLVGATAVAIGSYMGFRMLWLNYGRSYDEIDTHFKYGSIGAELANGLPYPVLMALPKVFPEHFGKTGDFREFGFLYEKGVPDPDVGRGLPIGFATGYRSSIDVAWFNCAVCHTGRVKAPGAPEAVTVLGMAANTVDLERFFLALFDMAVDERFALATLEKEFPDGHRLNALERLLWNWVVFPNTRDTLIARRSQLLPLLRPDPLMSRRSGKYCRTVTEQAANAARGGRQCTSTLELAVAPPRSPRPFDDPKRSETSRWGPGRVDTFNPYKLIHFDISAECLSDQERVGVAKFPSIFLQKPRGDRAMHLHWDGNNASLKERNLSAALGAGVTELTVNHASLKRIEKWLGTLTPPPSPMNATANDAELNSGKQIYMRVCANCHGYKGPLNYVFEGARLGQIEPLIYVQTDPSRLNSYTQEMEKYQKDSLFCGSDEHRFRQFKKTDGYANMPLDGLWLRGPYLHNGSVPTLADLLNRPEERPKAFLRGARHIAIDPHKGGFVATPCAPSAGTAGRTSADSFDSFCFDTSLRGNSNRGHLYGVDLSAADKHDLLQYLKTF